MQVSATPRTHVPCGRHFASSCARTTASTSIATRPRRHSTRRQGERAWPFASKTAPSGSGRREPASPAGSPQVAAVSVLGAGGGVAAAVVAALLLNARYVPIGVTVAQSFRGHVLKRFGESQLVVDESRALAGGGTPRFDRRILLGVGAML